MRSIKRPALPAAPKITLSDGLEQHALASGSTPDEYRRIALAALWHAQEPGDRPTQSFDIFNRFKIDDGTKSLASKYKTLAEIRIEAPWSASSPEASPLFDPEKDILKSLVFVDTDGVEWETSECKPITSVEMHMGVVFQDDSGQIWFHGADQKGLETYPECEMLLKRISPEMTAGLIADIGEDGLTDMMPFLGDIGIASRDILMQFTKSSTMPLDGADKDSFALDLLKYGVSAAAEKTARENTIKDIITKHLTVEALSFLKEGVTFPIDKNELSNHQRDNRDHQAGFGKISRAFMDEFMADGWIGKCPNNGPRDVRSFNAWNDWVDVANGDKDEENKWRKYDLARAPAFAVLRTQFIAATVDVEMDKEKSLSPDGKISMNDRVKFDVTEDEMDVIIGMAIKGTLDTFQWEKLEMGMSHIDHSSSLDGSRVHPGGSIFAPVLHSFDSKHKMQVLPLLDTPKIARHLELSLPSGEMVICDDFRELEGFEEGLKKLLPDRDYYSIDNAEGIDLRMQDYFEHAGLVIVQVGNSSPSAYQDTPGIWRTGYVDEDNEAFWTEGGERNDVALPEQEWSTSTGVWANIFADRSVLIDIMMVSGEFDDRSEADKAFEDFLGDSEASVAKPGVDHLHIYAPTGYGTNNVSFGKEFKVDELEYPDWRRDKYILSAKPLTPGAGMMVEEKDWVEGRIKLEAPEAPPEP